MNEHLERVLANEKLPSPPAVAVRLLDLATQPQVKIEEIAKALSADPTLAARVINYCNSPALGIAREIKSLPQAVTLLGMRTIKLLSLSFSLMETKSNGENQFDYDQFWIRSLAAGICAKQLGQTLEIDGDEEFLVGLVLNIGQIGLATTFPKQYGQLCEEARSSLTIAADREREIWGFDRFELGGKLLAKWSFPESVVTSVECFSDDATDCSATAGANRLVISQLVAELLLSPCYESDHIDSVRRKATDLLGISATDFDACFDRIVTDWHSFALVLNTNQLEFQTIEELESLARDSIVKISLGMDAELQRVERQKEELLECAYIDALTGLKNRAAYESETASVVDYHYRSGRPFGMLVIDVDHFKQINDSQGHGKGDEVLQAIGNALKLHCRSYDTVYRFGGEEFVCLICDCEMSAIASVAERFRKAVEELEIKLADGSSTRATVSIGVAWTERVHANSVQQLFDEADRNLYEAKRLGRNRCVLELPESCELAPKRIRTGAGKPVETTTAGTIA